MLLDSKKGRSLERAKVTIIRNQGETDANKTQNLGMYVATDTFFLRSSDIKTEV
jgi:hypothetical protein